jgi:hypothetical protein
LFPWLEVSKVEVLAPPARGRNTLEPNVSVFGRESSREDVVQVGVVGIVSKMSEDVAFPAEARDFKAPLRSEGAGYLAEVLNVIVEAGEAGSECEVAQEFGDSPQKHEPLFVPYVRAAITHR